MSDSLIFRFSALKHAVSFCQKGNKAVRVPADFLASDKLFSQEKNIGGLIVAVFPRLGYLLPDFIDCSAAVVVACVEHAAGCGFGFVHG